ncbi:MAG: M48 family metalloprotease [Pseudomonadota bacterium]
MRAFIRILLVLGFVAGGTVSEAMAQGRISFIRDAEIETIIRQMARPIFQAAGLNPSAVDIYLVNDRDLNAFVAGGQNMFLNTGLIARTESPGELLGVIAHEAGHIAGGHLARGQEQIERARQLAILTTLLGAAAAAAGGADIGAATAAGGQASALSSMLSYSRTMESAADQAAMRYLDQAGYSSEGMLSFLETLQDQDLLPSSRQTEYLRTHPLTFDRIEAVRNHVGRSPRTGLEFSPQVWDQFERVRAKLIGFQQPQLALQMYPASASGIAPRYGRAIALYRLGQLNQATSVMNQLIAAEPSNPYFQELMGQILFENGRLQEARPFYERADQLLPGEPLIQVALARILISEGGQANLQEAVDMLTTAVQRPGGRSPFAFRLLATAYGRMDNMGMTALSLAEEALALGDAQTANRQAARALQLLPNGAPGYLRALDVQREAQRLQER